MANLNDFKYVNEKSKKYYDYMKLNQNLSDLEKTRYGFYGLIIENVTGIKDIDVIIDSIIDTEFCSTLLNIKNNDFGIDAVVFDDDNNVIKLFNFKFRESFRQNKAQQTNDVATSMKFLSFILSEDLASLNSKTKDKLEKIIERLHSPAPWILELYMVSNENSPLPENDEFINNLKDYTEIEIKSIILETICNFTSQKLKNINAEIILDNDKIMPYEESSKSTSKSLIVILNAFELIKITCNDEQIRNSKQIDDYKILEKVLLNKAILFDNVIGYLGETKFNKNIFSTLEKEPTKFFMYNNGITITVKNITSKEINAGKKLHIRLEGIQLVNGGQTLNSIFKFKDKHFDENNLINSRILIKFLQTDNDDKLTNSIAEYTNSQNAISSTDLKSISNLQIKIEEVLKDYNILYVRKVGEFGDAEKSYEYRFSMERLAQIIYSKKGYPYRVTTNKKKLFETYYDEIFNEELAFDKLNKYIIEYNEIEKAYKNKNLYGFDQKYFYVAYLNEYKYDIDKNIDLIENALKSYKKYESIADARKLIQKGFMDIINEYL